jgi:hypothetical protein
MDQIPLTSQSNGTGQNTSVTNSNAHPDHYSNTHLQPNQPQGNEPIAIIGMSCHYPGGLTDPDKLWNFILEGRVASNKIPERKFSYNGIFHPDPEHAGSVYTQGAFFLSEDTDCFDAPFFNLKREEVMQMDPQQRLLLENVYHALENGPYQHSFDGNHLLNIYLLKPAFQFRTLPTPQLQSLWEPLRMTIFRSWIWT